MPNPSVKYFKIGEAAKILGVSIDTLRRWEKAGKIQAIRTPGGTRLYPVSALQKINPSSVENFESTNLSTEALLTKAEASNIFSAPITFPTFNTPSAPNSTKSNIKSKILTSLFTGSIITLFFTLIITAWITASYLTNPQDAKQFFKNNIASGLFSPFNFLSEKTIAVLDRQKARDLGFVPPDNPPPIAYKLKPIPSSSVLAVTASSRFLEVNSDTQINGSLFVRDSINGLSLEATPSANTFALGSGNTLLTVTNDALLDQNVSTTSSPTFNALNLSATNNQLVFQSGGPTGTLTWTPTAARVITLPDTTTTLVGTDATQTLTNKTLSGSSNTFSSIPNSALSNSKVTVTAGTNLSGGGDVNLGSSITLSLKDSPSITSLTASGVINLADGTAAAPSLTFTNDTDTGLYRIGTNKIGLITAGSATSGVTIDANGNVGIANISPSYKLDVTGQVNGSSGICINGDCKTTWTAVGGYTASNGLTLSSTDFQLGGALSRATGIDIAGQNFGFLGNIGIGTSNNSGARLSVLGGNVGIGTTTSNSTLSVAGSAHIGSLYQGISAPTDGLFVDGNVGIGASTSSNKLDVWGDTRMAGTATIDSILTAALSFTGSTPSITSGSSVLGLFAGGNVGIGSTGNLMAALTVRGTGTSTGRTFQTYGTNLTPGLTVLDNGNVGIGTTSPTNDTLEIVRSGSAATYSQSSYSNSALDGNYFRFYRGRGTQPSPTAVQSGDIIFDIIGWARHSSGWSGATEIWSDVDGSVSGSNVPGSIAFATTDRSLGWAERMRLTSTGNLGIGTSQAQAKLVIQGNVGIGYTGASQAIPVNGLAVFGNVGIGITTANSNLSISGNAHIGSLYQGIAAPTDGLFVDGNVGIGATTSTNKLDVWGNVGIGSSATITSALVAGSIQDNGSLVVAGSSYLQGITATSLVTPAFQLTTGAGANYIMTSDASGNASWASSMSGGLIADDSLDFAQFKDAMALDASTDIALGAYNLTTSGTGAVAFNNTGTFTVAGAATFNSTINTNTFNSTALTFTGSGNVGISASVASTNLNLNPGAGGSVNIAGGSGSTGCTIDDTTGSLTCSGSIGVGSSSGQSGLWSRTDTTLSPAYTGDNISTSGNISATGTGAITSGGTLTAQNGFTMSTGALSLTSTSGTAALNLSLVTNAFNVNGNTFGIDTFNGRVGIGTSSPTSTLTVIGNVGIGTSAAGAALQVNGGGLFGWGTASVAAPANGLAVFGNVGIGTTTANTQLHVKSNGETSITVESAGTAYDSQIVFNRSGNSNSYIGPASSSTFDIWTVENIPFRFALNDSEKMRINTNGNLGIGTSSPLSLLSVSGGAHIGSVRQGISAPTDGLFVDGNVGIGATTSTNKLDVWGGANITGNVGIGSSLTVTSATTLSGGLLVNGGSVVLPAGSIQNSELENSSITVTATAGTGLSVSGSPVSLGGTLTVAGIDASTSVKGVASFNSTNFSVSSGAVNTIQDIATSSTPTFAGLSLSSGNLGIGTSTTGAKLQVNGGAILWPSTTSLTGPTNGLATFGNVGIGTTTANSNLSISGNAHIGSLRQGIAAPADGLFVDGNVGIGATTSTNKLDVWGNVGIGSSLTVTSATTLSGGLLVNGGSVVLPAGSIQNSELENSSITVTATAGTGLSVSGSPVSLGGTLTVAGIDASTSVKGVASFNSTNFSVSSGAVNTIQDIATSSTPTFAGLSLSSGNLGIGTSTTGAKLQVNGGAIFWPSTTSLTGPSDGLAVFGNVGIGTTSPGQKLEVNGNIGIGSYTLYGTSNISTLYGLNVSRSGGDGAGYPDIYGGTGLGLRAAAASGSYINLKSTTLELSEGDGGALAMAINAGGNVGIGTTGPTSKLEIFDDTNGAILRLSRDAGNLRGNLEFGRNNTGSFQTVAKIDSNSDTASVNNGDLRFWTTTNVGTLTQRMRIDSNGNVGIGTSSPLSLLSVTGNAHIGSVRQGIAAPTDGLFVDGNVGIGATTSSNKLDVWGNVGIGSSATIGSNLTLSGYNCSGLGNSGKLTTDASGNVICSADQGGGGSSALSAITAAAAANSINNGDYAQTWNWQLTTADKAAFTFGENTASTATGKSAILVASTLANSTAMPLYVQNYGNGLSFRVDDVSGDTTPFVIDAGGNVGIGLSAPTALLDISSAASTTNAMNLGINSLSTGIGLNLSSTSTALSSGTLMKLNWNPGSTTIATGDLLNIGIGSSGVIGNFLNIQDNGSSVFAVSQTTLTSNLPASFTAPGDVSIAYDINMANPTASYIKSQAPLYLVAGELFNSSDLVLQTYNQGTIVLYKDFAGGTATTNYVSQISATDATSVGHTDYGLYSNLTFTGNAAKTGVGLYSTLSTTSTTADTMIAADLATTTTGVITTGTRSIYGLRSQPTSTAASTGGTTNVYGVYSKAGGTISGGSINTYGLYIANDSMNTTGTTLNYGLYIENMTGADFNYSAAFVGGNVGIGTSFPNATLAIQGSVGIGYTGPNQTMPSNGLAVSGNVGIGTSSTAQALEVNGRIRMNTWTADGTTAVYYNSANGDIGVQSSDVRLKTNISPITNSLDIIKGISGITFNWLTDGPGSSKTVGVIAQDVMQVMPELVFPITGADGQSYFGVHYDKLAPILINAVKEQQIEIDNLIAQQATSSGLLVNLSVEPDGTINIPKLKTAKLDLNNQNSYFDLNTDLQAKDLKIASLETQTATTSATLVATSNKVDSTQAQLDILAAQIASLSAQIAGIQTSATPSAQTTTALVATPSAQTASASAQIATSSAMLTASSSAAASNCTLYPATCTLNLTPPDILLATSSAILANITVTSDATLSGRLSAYDAIISNSLKSLGQTTLGSTILAGDLTIDGTMSINGSSINSTPTLYLQNSILSNLVDIFNGQLTIDSQGNLVTAGKVSANEVAANKLIISTPSIGTGIIPANSLTITIPTQAITPTSKVFITPTTPTGGQGLIVSRKLPGYGFTVNLENTYYRDIKFDWFIVDEN